MYRRYFIASAIFAAFAGLTIVAYSFLANPYAMFVSVTGLEQYERKTDLFYHLRLHKPYAMERRKATHLIVGSSRSARLNPDVFGEKGYNASMPGIRLSEVRRLIEHAQAIQPLDSLYIGVDYYMFRASKMSLTSHYSDERLRKISPTLRDRLAYRMQSVKDAWSTLLSIDAILASAKEISGIGQGQRIYFDNGTWASNSPGKPPKWLYAYVNRHKMEEFKSAGGDPTMVEFEQLLKFTGDNNIPTTILISPFHGSVMNTVRLADSWTSYMSWQRSVVAAVEDAKGQFEVVGLETSRKITLEAMNQDLPFYLDGVHYKLSSGREIMNCLVGESCNKNIRLVRLNNESIDQYLKNVDTLMNLYPRQRPDDYNSLTKWLDRD
ncbi:MAG: hypothetical protein ABJK25_08805 [Halieaceae bacterium]